MRHSNCRGAHAVTLAAVFLSIGLFCVAAAWAQEPQNVTVKAIQFKGLKGVSEQLARSNLETQIGQPYSPNVVARDIRRLHSLGHFETIKVDAAQAADGITLTYILEEKRIIDTIKILGNNKLRVNKIRAVLSWKEGDSFAADAYDEERKAILKLYEEKGFANTSVDINVEEIGPARVRVTYTINEGKKARIRSINFEGNQALSGRDLRKVMKVKKAHWFLGGKYNEPKLETDLKSIVDKYGDIGHLEASITGTNVGYSPNGKKMDITISVAEGAQYHVGTIETAHNTVYDDDEILSIAKVHAGDVHNKGQVAKDAELVAKGYHDSGYVNAEVTPQVTLDRENKTTHLVQNVKEGDLKYVKEIEVTGNATTKDEVVRRNLMVTPGERVNGSDLKLSKQGLENTRYFENIRLTLHDVEDDPLYTNVMLDIEEGKTGNFNFGAGYSSEEKIGGFVELRLNNFDIANWPTFSGGGQLFTTKLHLGTVRSQFNIGFTDPEFLGYPLMFGFDVLDESYAYRHNSDYTEETKGGQIRFGKALSPYLTLKTALRVTDVDYSDLQSRWWYTSTWRRELVPSTTVANSWSIERKTLDITRDPTSGSQQELVLTIAGLGGDNNFLRIEQDSRWFFPLDEHKKWIFSYRSRAGWATAYGDSDFVPISERFFAGGTTTVRGYDNRDVGPRVRRYWFSNDMQPIGGDVRLVSNFELKYKITDILRLYAFVDSGGVWRDENDFSFSGIKYSSGLGLGVEIPRIGPVRVDYGVPINPEKYQGSGRLHLMSGFTF